MAKILVAGLNPAWQQVLVLPALNIGEVNRATSSHAMAGGKGMNAAKILAREGHDVSLLHVLAGTNGDRMLDACTALGILSLHVFSGGETRAAVTLVHEGVATEVIEPFSASAIAGADLEEELLEAVPHDVEYDALLVSGTLPAGLDASFYGKLIARVSCKRILWDSAVPFDEATARRLTWLKVNAAEHRALAPLLEKYGARPALLITDGPEKTVVANSGEGAGNYSLPALESIVSPIGAGDTVAAMLTHGLLTGGSVSESVKRALACASASCLSPLPAEWKPWDADRLEKGITWQA
jgi:fructose-1-phosphate kinase PfkB-like protein